MRLVNIVYLTFPSYQTDLEDMDVLAFRAYLIREKICENLVRDDAITSPAVAPPSTSSDSYWDRAKHIIELVWWHLRRYGLIGVHARISEDQASSGVKVYRNMKNMKALCIQGNEGFHCGVVSTSQRDFSVNCPMATFVY